MKRYTKALKRIKSDVISFGDNGGYVKCSVNDFGLLDELLSLMPKLVKEVKNGLYPSEYDDVFESLGINYKVWEQ